MLSFYEAAALAAAPKRVSFDPRLQRLIEERVSDWSATGLLDLTHLLVVQADDTEQDIEEAVAFSPVVNPIDNERYPSPNFLPFWDWFEQHDGWFELIFTVGNDGFAFVLLVEDTDYLEPDLRDLCLTYGKEVSCVG